MNEGTKPQSNQCVVAIGAMTENRVIGHNNAMPWHLPRDLRHFKELTSGHPVIMGRRTFESMGSKPLPKRRNIIITRTPLTGLETHAELAAALAACAGEDQVFVIGGAQLYQSAFASNLIDRVELTRINKTIAGDTYFPEFESNFTRIAATEANDGEVQLCFETWLRN
jgi:dihydrofolate reductase